MTLDEALEMMVMAEMDSGHVKKAAGKYIIARNMLMYDAGKAALLAAGPDPNPIGPPEPGTSRNIGHDYVFGMFPKVCTILRDLENSPDGTEVKPA